MPNSINKKRKLQSVKASVRNGISSAGDAASEKARSARDATADGVKAVAESSPAQSLVSAGDSAAQIARDAVYQGSEIAGHATARGRRFAGDGIGSAKERVPWRSAMPDEARDKLVSAIESSKTLSGSAKRKMTAQLTLRLDTLFRKGMGSQAQIFSILQTSLAIPEASSLLNAWLQDIVKGTPTIYDKAMDAAYNSTRIGGGDHQAFRRRAHNRRCVPGCEKRLSRRRHLRGSRRFPAGACAGCDNSQRASAGDLGSRDLQWPDQCSGQGWNTQGLGRGHGQLRRDRADWRVARLPRDSSQLEQ